MKKKEENVIWSFVNKHPNLIYFIIITVFAIVARFLMFDYYSSDYTTFLKPWFDTLKQYGGLTGLSQNIGNYTPIYMTLLAILTYFPIKSIVSIKILSIIFDFIGAIAAKRIVGEVLKDHKHKDKISLMIYALYLFLPTVLLNGAYWAQCDSIYAAFVVLSLLYLIKKNYKIAIIFWAIAFSFKFQAILIFPLFVLMYIAERKIKFKYFLIIPATIFVLSIPKVIFSHDLLAGFKVYFEQAGAYSEYITLNFPNFYSIFLGNGQNNLINTPFKEFGTIGIIITFIILVTITYIVYTKKIKFDGKAIIDFGLYMVLIMAFFLPQMHERYLFMGDVIGLLYLAINIKKFYYPIMIEFVSLYGYMFFLFSGNATSFSTVSIIYLVLMILYTKDMHSKYLKISESR